MVINSKIIQNLPCTLYTLIPGLDMLNHDDILTIKKGITCGYDNDATSVVYTPKNVKKDEEICMSYGYRSNLLLFIFQGFIVPNLSCDTVLLLRFQTYFLKGLWDKNSLQYLSIPLCQQQSTSCTSCNIRGIYSYVIIYMHIYRYIYTYIYYFFRRLLHWDQIWPYMFGNSLPENIQYQIFISRRKEIKKLQIIQEYLSSNTKFTNLSADTILGVLVNPINENVRINYK